MSKLEILQWKYCIWKLIHKIANGNEAFGHNLDKMFIWVSQGNLLLLAIIKTINTSLWKVAIGKFVKRFEFESAFLDEITLQI